MMLDRRLVKNFNWSIFSLIMVICVVGLVNLYSASYQTGLSVFKKQLLWVVLGIFGMVLISFLDTKTIERYTQYAYIASVLLLITVLVLGKEVSGSKSWISLGSYITIQPSEFAKIPVILALAKFYHNDFEDAPYGFRDLVKPIFFVALPVLLVMLQPDLGTAFMIVLISGSLVLFMGLRIRSIIFLLILAVGLSFPTWHLFLKDYQKERIETFLDPSRDPLGSATTPSNPRLPSVPERYSERGL
jgi:Bacterial cell division membrane protein